MSTSSSQLTLSPTSSPTSLETRRLVSKTSPIISTDSPTTGSVANAGSTVFGEINTNKRSLSKSIPTHPAFSQPSSSSVRRVQEVDQQTLSSAFSPASLEARRLASRVSIATSADSSTAKSVANAGRSKVLKESQKNRSLSAARMLSSGSTASHHHASQPSSSIAPSPQKSSWKIPFDFEYISKEFKLNIKDLKNQGLSELYDQLNKLIVKNNINVLESLNREKLKELKKSIDGETYSDFIFKARDTSELLEFILEKKYLVDKKAIFPCCVVS